MKKKTLKIIELLPEKIAGVPVRSTLLGLTSSQLLAGSLVMVIGSNFYNLGQFVYHSVTGRLLGKAFYGDFAALLSIFGFVGIIQLSLSLTIVKFIAQSKNKKEERNFAKWVVWWSYLMSGLLSLIIVLIAPWLADFLNISEPRAVYLPAIIIFFFFTTFSMRSVLQGLMNFEKYVAVLMTESVVKIIFSGLFIVAGFALFGALGGLLLGSIASFFLARFFLKNYLKGERGKRPVILPLLKFTVPVFLHGLAWTAFYTTDLLLVKHFLDVKTASLYAALAILGRVVFFGTSPITQVMFPIVAKKHFNKEPYMKILYLSVLLVVGFAFATTLFYYVFPQLPILVLYGNEYLDGASYLWRFGVFMGLLGISSLLTQFYLSIGQTKIVIFFLIAALMQGVLIWFEHDSILKVVHMSIISATFLTVSLMAYHFNFSRAKN